MTAWPDELAGAAETIRDELREQVQALTDLTNLPYLPEGIGMTTKVSADATDTVLHELMLRPRTRM